MNHHWYLYEMHNPVQAILSESPLRTTKILFSLEMFPINSGILLFLLIGIVERRRCRRYELWGDTLFLLIQSYRGGFSIRFIADCFLLPWIGVNRTDIVSPHLINRLHYRCYIISHLFGLYAFSQRHSFLISKFSNQHSKYTLT